MGINPQPGAAPLFCTGSAVEPVRPLHAHRADACTAQQHPTAPGLGRQGMPTRASFPQQCVQARATTMATLAAHREQGPGPSCATHATTGKPPLSISRVWERRLTSGLRVVRPRDSDPPGGFGRSRRRPVARAPCPVSPKLPGRRARGQRAAHDPRGAARQRDPRHTAPQRRPHCPPSSPPGPCPALSTMHTGTGQGMGKARQSTSHRRWPMASMCKAMEFVWVGR